MKRIFSILLITALLVALMPLMSTVALAEEYATITSENGYGVRLREGPSKAYNPLGTFDVGTTVVVLQRGDEWSQLQIGSTVGWMMNKYLIFGVSGSTTGGASVGAANAVVVSDNGLRVWLRATPGGTRLFLNSPGTPVTVMAGDKEWCQVSINGTIGYMMTKYLAVEKVDPVDYELKSATINYYYPVVGDTLVVNLEPSSATVTYEWYVDGQLLGTEDTFEVLTRYANQTIKVKVTGTGNYYGSAVDTVYPVQINRGIKSVALSEKVPVVGETLEAVIQPSSAEVDYSWRVGGVHVSSEATYTPTEDDLGKLIQLKVTGINGFSGSAACTAENVVVSDKVVQYVELSNHYPVVGEVLTAEIYPSSADVNITWYADGEVVSVTGSYQTAELDLGKKIKVVVEGVEPYSGTATDISANVASATITGVSLTSSEVMTGDGEYIMANIAPSKATAYYYWYVDEDTLIAGPTLSSTLELTDALVKNYNLIGKQLWVSAVGTGVYTGSVVSDLSGELVTNKKVTEVAIDNLAPAVGDTLSVTLKPSNLNDVQNQLTYVWMVGTETKTGYNQPTYKVQESDVGKPIRVKVVGANGYTGEAYSTYTNDVLERSWLTDVYIYNKTTGENAAHYSPEAGHAVYAVVAPVGANGVYTGNYSQNSDGFINNGYNDDFVTYTWSVGGYSFQGDGFVVPEEFAGERITVTAKPKAGSTYYYSGYDYSVSATSQPIVKREAMNTVVTLAAPVVGVTPDYDPGVYVVEGYHDANVSVTWTEDGYNPAVLDAYGCYLPGTSYTAVLKVTPVDDDVTLYGATVNVYDHSTNSSYAATQIEEGSSLFYVRFGSTGMTTVNDLYIADLDAPVVGGELDTECGNDQVVGNVTWSYADDKYTACIELKTYIGYTLNGLEDNVFHVAGATETKYTAGTNIIYATFEIEHELSIQSDKDFVYLDGYNRRIVQCSAHLSNYIGELENIKWEIVDAKVDGTSINNHGQLIIGMYEETERTLTVRATVIVDGDEYVAEKAIQIFSGTDTDTALKVVFTKYSPEITRGGRGYFEAVVSNSSDGCQLFAIYEDGTSAPITDGWLNIPMNMEDEYVIVKGISNEDHSVSCTMLITITEPTMIEWTDDGIVEVEHGKTYDFSATAILPDGSTKPCDIYVNGQQAQNGEYTVSKTETSAELTVRAVRGDTFAEKKVPVKDSESIHIVIEAPAKVRVGYPVSITANVVFPNTTVPADITVSAGTFADGKLSVTADQVGTIITVTASYEGVTSATANVAVYPEPSIRFTESADVITRGDSAKFAAVATVDGVEHACTITARGGITSEKTLTDGVVKYSDFNKTTLTDVTVTVTAKYVDDGLELSATHEVVLPSRFSSSYSLTEGGDAGIMTLDLYGEEDTNIAIDELPGAEEPENIVIELEPETEEPAVEEETEDIVIELAPETEEPVVEEEPSAEEAAVEEEPETIMIEVETETEEPVVEEAAEPEVEEEPETIVIVVDTTEPVVEEEETEEVVTEEPAVEEETEEVVTEEPAAEEETEEVVTEEPAVEEETEEVVTEEPAAEEETEEVVTEEPAAEEETEEVASEEPVVEEETEELTGVVLSIKDTITGEVVEEIVIEEESEEEEEAEEEKPSKKDRKNRKNRKDQPAEEVIETEEEDETLDALEGDDIGESAESESAIKISFTKRANKIKLGNYSTFEVAVSGSEEGVIWSLRLSEDVNGEPVSSIDQDGRVTISLDEKAEKLIVVATSREDRTVRARWIVEVTEGEDEEIITEEVTDETVITEEETTVEEPVAEETVTDEEAIAEAALAEENNVPEETVEETDEIEEELITVEEGGSLLDMF